MGGLSIWNCPSVVVRVLAAILVELSLWGSRWIQPLLYRQSARDPAVYAAVAALIVFVAVGASAVPAVRASHADPNRALREE